MNHRGVFLLVVEKPLRKHDDPEIKEEVSGAQRGDDGYSSATFEAHQDGRMVHFCY